jgi:hypothetical protein
MSEPTDPNTRLTAPPEPGRSPLELGRVTLFGPCRRVEDSEREEARHIYLSAQPDAAQYVDFKDFAFYRLEPMALRYVGGFGRMSWVSIDAYRAASPEPLAPSVEGTFGTRE